MSDNKQILKHCPNFYKIINFNPLIEDTLTEKIIHMYKEYIFNIDLNNNDDIKCIKELDEAVAKYINDFSFRRQLQEEIVKVKVKTDCTDVLKFFVDQILKIFTNYQDVTTRVIYVSRWI